MNVTLNAQALRSLAQYPAIQAAFPTAAVLASAISAGCSSCNRNSMNPDVLSATDQALNNFRMDVVNSTGYQKNLVLSVLNVQAVEIFYQDPLLGQVVSKVLSA